MEYLLSVRKYLFPIEFYIESLWQLFELQQIHKGQLISKANYQALNSSKKRTNEFVFTTMRRVFVRFLEEIEDSKKAFRNYLTFSIHTFFIWYIRYHCILYCLQFLGQFTIYSKKSAPGEPLF